MDEYVTKHVDVKRVVSPNTTLLLETSNNIVIDTDPERIIVGGMCLPDYIQSQIFQVTSVPTAPSELEGTSTKSAGATVNFDAVYSNEGEFRTHETRCAGVDASGSYINTDRAHAITLDAASNIRLSAKTVDNIYVKNQTMREVIYNMVNTARLRNSARYDIRTFEHAPVTYSAIGRESAHMGTVHTNTLRTHKITTNHTLIDGQQPDLVIRSSAGVSMNTPDLYLNNELFQEYIKQFMDERQFFTLTVNTSPGNIIPYDFSDFTVREHGPTFDYQVQLFMYQKDTPDSEVQSGVAVHEDESSIHVINTVQFPYEEGKVLYEGSFRNLTPGQYYNMYADFLNLRTMTLVPKVHVMDDVLTVTLKSFTVEIINESLIAFHIQKYEDELGALYGPGFVFNLLINDSNLAGYNLSNTELKVVPSMYDYTYTNLSNLTQTSKAVSNESIIGVLVFDDSNSNLIDGPRSNVKTTVNYIDYTNNTFPFSFVAAPVYNYHSDHTFNVYTPLLKILTPTQNFSSNVYSNTFISNVVLSTTSKIIKKVSYSNPLFEFYIEGSNLSNNWPLYLSSNYSNLPKFDYLSFGVMLTIGANEYIYDPDYAHTIKYRSAFSNTDADMKIYIDKTITSELTSAESVILRGNSNDITISLLYKSIYTGFQLTSSQMFGNTVLKALKENNSNVAVAQISGNRLFEIDLNDSNIHFIDSNLNYTVSAFKISQGGTVFVSNWTNATLPLSSDSSYNISDEKVQYMVPNTWLGYSTKINVTISDNLGRNFDYTSSNYTINDITGSIANGTISSNNFKRSRTFKITPQIDQISTGSTAGSTGIGGTITWSSAPVSTINATVPNDEGNITYPNIVTTTTYELSFKYEDSYGFYKDIVGTRIVTVRQINATIDTISFKEKPRIYSYRTKITQISDGTTTHAADGNWTHNSINNSGIHCNLPSGDNFENRDGEFQAFDRLTATTYNISNTYTDRYGFSKTFAGNLAIPTGHLDFVNQNIAWNKEAYSRTFAITQSPNYDYLGQYAWSTTPTNIIEGASQNSTVELTSDVPSGTLLGCLNISLCNQYGFSGSQNANNLSLDPLIHANTFATYSIAFTTGTPRTFGLTAGTPATTTIDTVTNSNTPQSYAWSNSSESLSTSANCDLAVDYLIQNGLTATIYCVVTTRNIVGFDDEITTGGYTVAGTFPSFTGTHTLSFSNTTTPDFSVTLTVAGNTTSYNTGNSNFVLTYEGSSNDITYSNVSETDYISWNYIRMVGRTVCNRGFHNTSTSNLAIFNAANYKPVNPPAPTVKTRSGSIEVKTCSNITFLSIASDAIGSNGTPERSNPTIAIKRSSTSGGSYGNAVTQTFDTDVVVPDLSPGTTYYFKYSKSYTSNTWTAVDLTEYISSSGIFTEVTTLSIPSVSGNIYSQYYSSTDLILVLGNLIYPTFEINYSSTYTIKLLVSQTSNNLLNVDTLTVAETFTTNRYDGSTQRIFADGNMSNMTGNVYEIIVPSESSNAGEVKIGHSADVVYTDYYVAIKLEFDENYYPNIIGPISAGRTSYQRPDIPKFRRTPTSVTVDLRSNLTINFDTTGLVWEISSNGNPSKNPSKIIMVATTDSNVMRNDNINFSAGNNSNYLRIKPATDHIYSTADVNTGSSTDVDLDIHDGTVRAGDLYMFFISIYNTFSNSDIPGFEGRGANDFVYNFWRNAMPYNLASMWQTNNFVKKLTLSEPSDPSDLTVTVQNSTTSIMQLVWQHGSVTYNDGSYQVYQHKWAIDESLSGMFSTQTSNVSGAPSTGSNYTISPVPTKNGSYYVKLYVSYDNTNNWKSVITSSQISTPIPDAPSYTAANVIKTTLNALEFDVTLIQSNSHKGFDSHFTKYRIQSGTIYDEGIDSNLIITGLQVNQTYNIDIVKKYSNEGVEWDSDTFTLSNIQTRNYDPPSQSMLAYYGRLNSGIYFSLISLQTNEYYRSVSRVSFKSSVTGLKTTIVTTTAGSTTLYRVEPVNPFPDWSYSNIQFTLQYSPYSDPTADPPIDYSGGLYVDVDTTIFPLSVKTSHFTVYSSAITVHSRIGFTINLTSASNYDFIAAAMGGHSYTLKFVSVYVYTDNTFTNLDTKIPFYNGAGYMLKLSPGQMTVNYYGPYTGNKLYLKFKLISDHPVSGYKFGQDHIVYQHPTPLILGNAYMSSPSVMDNAWELIELVKTEVWPYGTYNTWIKLTFKESYRNLKIDEMYYVITNIKWRINHTGAGTVDNPLNVGSTIHDVQRMSFIWGITFNLRSRFLYFPRRWFNGWIEQLELNLTLKTKTFFNGTTYPSSADVTMPVKIYQTGTTTGHVDMDLNDFTIGPYLWGTFSGEPAS